MHNENDRDELEKIADTSDEATRTEMAFTEERIREASRKVQQRQKPQADGSYAITECEDCGEEIGEQRLRIAPNNLCCTHCATLAERRR